MKSIMDATVHNGWIAMTEDSRGNTQRRTLRILVALMEGQTLTRKSGAALLDVNDECVGRIFDVLLEEVPGITAVGRKPTHYSFDPTSTSRDHLKPAPDLLHALAASLGAASSKAFSGTAYEQQLRGHRDAVVRGLSATRQAMFKNISRKLYVVGGQEELLEDKSELFDAALDAVLKSQCVRMRYQRFNGVVEELELRLYTLVFYDSHLYVVGNGSAAAFYPYRFSRILEIDPTGRTFTYPASSEYSPESVFRDGIGIFVDPEPCRVVVRLSSEWKTYAAHHRWHNSQRVQQRPDGYVDVELHIRPCRELQQWILKFGEDAEVLEPSWLRDKIAERVREAAARYG